MDWKIVGKWLNHSITFLLFTVFTLVIIAVISVKMNGNILGYQFKTVLSGSMEPTIKTGSVISIKLLEDSTTLNEGDIVTFIKEDETLVTHRIAEVKNNGEFYITKGDNNRILDNEP